MTKLPSLPYHAIRKHGKTTLFGILLHFYWIIYIFITPFWETVHESDSGALILCCRVRATSSDVGLIYLSPFDGHNVNLCQSTSDRTVCVGLWFHNPVWSSFMMYHGYVQCSDSVVLKSYWHALGAVFTKTVVSYSKWNCYVHCMYLNPRDFYAWLLQLCTSYIYLFLYTICWDVVKRYTYDERCILIMMGVQFN